MGPIWQAQFKLTPTHGYYFLLRKVRINTIVAIFQSSSGYRPELGQIIDVWAKLLRRRRGGRGNKHTIGHLTRPTSYLPCYTRKSTSQLPVNNINSMDRLKLLSTTSSASKSGTDRTTKHTPELNIYRYIAMTIYISSCFFYFITIILI